MITHEILDGIGDAIYALDDAWRVTFFSRQAEAFFGLDRRDLLGRSIWDCFPAARGSELGDALERVMASRKADHLDLLSPSTGRWTDARVFPIAHGGIAVSWRDITSQKQQAIDLSRAVGAQERTARELGTIINHMPAMIAYWGRDLRCRFANNKYHEWFGPVADEMIGTSMPDLMGPELFEKNEPFVRAALAGEPQSFERTLRKPSGEVRQTWAQYIPEIDDQGLVHGFYALVTDVTPLKESEERLMQANAALELAREQAEAMTASKSAFLSNMSHELRNPLSSIIGYAELLSHRPGLGETERRYVARLEVASAALLNTINEVLDFSKLEAGQVKIERRPTDPLALGRQTLAMFEPQMDRKGLAHRFETEASPGLLLADETRLRQILTNLIGNAVKFTERGEVVLRCGYRKANETLRYEVQDTGPGVAPERQPDLFQRFSQLDTAARSFGGTGLGLAISRSLAHAMGGEVGVISAGGQGSTFWVELPAAPAPLVAPSGGALAANAAGLEDLAGLRLLIVDDEAANRELTRDIVEPLGVILTEAADGAQAVDLALAEPFDVVLMDLRMPELDGVAATRAIRSADGPNIRTPIVAFTGETPSRERAAHFDDWLAKPVVPRQLTDILVRFGRRSAVADPGAPARSADVG